MKKMADKKLIVREKVEHSGIFNFSHVYDYIHGWLTEEEGFLVAEEKYSEKLSGNARDITIEWTISKKISDYYKIEIKMKYEVGGLTDVEVEIDGKKEKTNKGKIAIDIKGFLIIDYENKWESSPFSRFMRGFYDKFIVPGRTSAMEDMVLNSVNGLIDNLKSILELSTRQL